ncbi:MAG: hypothetical protein H5T95_07895 [Firmicutes bacterium]|nr:hypothetical protein [Bacillota bacterium]
MMCCEGHAYHHGAREHAGGGCCCHAEPRYFHRRFFSREETLGMLKDYLEDLKAEVREVERRIECLEKDAHKEE